MYFSIKDHHAVCSAHPPSLNQFIGGYGGIGGVCLRQFPVFPHMAIFCRRQSPCFPLPLPHGGSQHRISRSQWRHPCVFPPTNDIKARRLRLFPPSITADAFSPLPSRLSPRFSVISNVNQPESPISRWSSGNGSCNNVVVYPPA